MGKSGFYALQPYGDEFIHSQGFPYDVDKTRVRLNRFKSRSCELKDNASPESDRRISPSRRQLKHGPVLPGLISMIGGPLNLNEVTQVATRLRWEARNERLVMGNARVRVYRLQLRLLDGYEVKILVSQIGEVLRVDLPDEIVLIHEDLIQRQE